MKIDSTTALKYGIAMMYNYRNANPDARPHDVAEYAAELTAKFVRAHDARGVDSDPVTWYDTLINH